MADTGRGYDAVIGWSLGGQLAARALAAGMLAPKKLVLIATPFQFVEMEKNGLGMKRDTFNTFFDNYMKHPMRALHKAWELIVHDDRHAPFIRENLQAFSKQGVLANDWLKWLGMIDGFSCESLDFRAFPPTLLVHGENDAVVEAEQSRRFAQRIPAARLEIWPDCGHAPHWHDTEKLRRLVGEHLHV